MGLVTRHLGIKYVWDKDKFGPKATAMLDDLVDKIIQMMEDHIG